MTLQERDLVGDEGRVVIRYDATWSVPEPELVVVINSQREVIGFTIGNDMSSRSIEGENPLYLPQAKVYEKSAGLGPCLYVTETPVAPAYPFRENESGSREAAPRR